MLPKSLKENLLREYEPLNYSSKTIILDNTSRQIKILGSIVKGRFSVKFKFVVYFSFSLPLSLLYFVIMAYTLFQASLITCIAQFYLITRTPKIRSHVYTDVTPVMREQQCLK